LVNRFTYPGSKFRGALLFLWSDDLAKRAIFENLPDQ